LQYWTYRWGIRHGGLWVRPLLATLARSDLANVLGRHRGQVRRRRGEPVVTGIPWLGFVVYPTHRLLKRRNAVRYSRRFARNLARVRAGELDAARLTASVRG